MSAPEAQDLPDASGWSATGYNNTASFVYSAQFTAPVLNLLTAKPGERILDLGCGSGELTLQLQDIVGKKEGGLIVGADLSESMIEKARSNGVHHAYVADAQALDLLFNKHEVMEGSFDAVFSNATLHWCKKNPEGVISGVRKLLKSGGRFVAEMGGFMNCIGTSLVTSCIFCRIRSALHDVIKSKGYDPVPIDPWYFPSVDDYSKLLVEGGFEVKHIEITPRITPLTTDVYDWLNLFVRNSFLRQFSDEEASEIMKVVQEQCRIDCQDASGKWQMMYVRLRFSATPISCG
ncbi:S-adenosyl-L-methionine-dependent methyltransferase [Panaeolus papilionaceus]|nr:S-adenosyl-L-methionine-dependent methyltransferase [Panaeolus papilionaceus]